MFDKYYFIHTPILKNRLIFSILISCTLILSTNSYAQDAVIEYTKDSREVIVSFSETHGVMSGKHAKTTLKIYGDGTVDVFIPIFMKKAGSYQMKLDKAQLDQLLQDLSAKNIPEFDTVKTQTDKNNEIAAAQLSSAQTTLYEVHDASITTIELNFDSYLKLSNKNSVNGQVFDSSNEILDMSKNITWKGIRSDSKKFPDIEAIQQLATTQQSLLKIVNDPQLEKR